MGQESSRSIGARMRRSRTEPPLQLGLFDLPETGDAYAGGKKTIAASSPEVRSNAQRVRKVSTCRDPAATRARVQRAARVELRTVSETDLPNYSPDLNAIVERSMAELPNAQMGFTYGDIQRSFGVSRATVARRMKGGLVPGIRFQNERIVEDGSVRRFDRLQLRYLLLSVRSSQSP